MGRTQRNIYYPDDYDESADIPKDMKDMAESINDLFDEVGRGQVNIIKQIVNINSSLNNIEAEQITQNTNIQNLSTNKANKSETYTKTETDNLLFNKVDKVAGKGLSTEDFTTAEKQKLASLENYDDTDVKTDISAIKTEQTTQNTNIEELQTQVETLQEDLDNAEVEIAELNTDITNMRKAMITVEGQGTDITLENTSENKLVEFELSGQTSQDTSKIVYICDGTETGDYYFTYNNINYQFTMPTVSSGDILVFNTITLVLSLNNTAITTETGTTGTELTFLTTPNSRLRMSY